MNTRHRALIFGLAAAAWLGAPTGARADAGISFRKAYTGTSGGNNNFGAGYRVEYGLSASKANANARVAGDARASTWFRLFGMTFEAAALKAAASGSVNTAAPTCAASLNYETFLVGIKIPAASGSYNGGVFVNKDLFVRSQRLTPRVYVPFVNVLGVTLAFEAFASATEYVRVNGTAWCDRVSAEFRPGVNLSATAAFIADAIIVASGVRGTLTLMDTSLPVTASAGWSWKSEFDLIEGGSFCTWSLGSSASSRLEIIPVAGLFDAFVRVGLPCVDIFGLLPGDGFCLNKEFSQKLWSTSAGRTTFPLTGLAREIRIGTGTASCPATPPTPPTR
jgi:hypothetical protein